MQHRELVHGKWLIALLGISLALGPAYNVLEFEGGPTVRSSPKYVEYEPAPFPRPCDLAVRDATPDRGGALQYAGAPRAGGEAPVGAGRALIAWPLPYRSGSLQASLSSAASLGKDVDVAIYDIAGREVRMLTGTERSALCPGTGRVPALSRGPLPWRCMP